MVNARPDLPRITALAGNLGLAALIAALMTAAAPASAQDTSQRDRFINAIFQAMDTDKDKSVSLGEFKGFGQNEFKAADTNKDGVISQSEFVDRRPNGKFTDQQLQQIRRQWTVQFVGLDQNGDGKVTTTEHGKVGDRAYKALDRDGNGKLTVDEMKAASAR
jgi:EF hand